MAIHPMEFDVPHRGLKWLEYYSGHTVYHPGWDLNKGIGNQDLGDPVVCPVSGEVEYVSKKPTKWNKYNGGFGWFVVIYHAGYGNWTRYAHLNKVSVEEGQKLEEGDRIGDVGKSGTNYAHLHWEVWKPEMFKIQSNHWRKFGYYPTNKTKSWVVDHYIDGLKWIEDINKKPQWREDAEKWASKYINDIPGLLGDFDGHRWIELIRRAINDKGI